MVCIDRGRDLRIIFPGGPEYNTELSYIILDPSNFLFKLHKMSACRARDKIYSKSLGGSTKM